ncbi:MAG: AAA family ATPase, partial [Candidatus Sericytochromatia bacterium]
MIPNRLRLMNFMSYAELDLDFRGWHSAVLSGANGAGKSSLLDAITYALWDKARGPAEQLIRLGQTEMWVELLFELEGAQYRVWRRRTKKAGGSGQLEFQQLAPGMDPEAEGAWVALTGGSARETQARLVETLRMDYETFVHSAFILQGRADAFTTKTPRERKAVLGEILGLGRYDALTARAREKWKQAQAEAEAIEAEQADLRDRLQAGEAVAAGLAETNAALAEASARSRQAEARWAAAT